MASYVHLVLPDTDDRCRHKSDMAETSPRKWSPASRFQRTPGHPEEHEEGSQALEGRRDGPGHVGSERRICGPQ